jgi:hypothetical protein
VLRFANNACRRNVKVSKYARDTTNGAPLSGGTGSSACLDNGQPREGFHGRNSYLRGKSFLVRSIST